MQFAHSSFCQKHCTTENAGVLGVLATMISINAIWACIRYKGRKDKIQAKLERLAKEEAEMRKEQQEVFNETFTKGEIDALRGAMVSNLKCDHPHDPRHPPFHLPTAQKETLPARSGADCIRH